MVSMQFSDRRLHQEQFSKVILNQLPFILPSWPHRGTVMHYSGYMGPQDGAVSILLLSQQEVVLCVHAVYSERNSHLGRQSVRQKSTMSQYEHEHEHELEFEFESEHEHILLALYLPALAL
jgi:hypothetical protein